LNADKTDDPFERIGKMAEITAALVKELRERTGQGMMDCKKALTAAGGDIEKAIDDMRAAGSIKAAKKAGNIAAEGSVAVKLAADNKAAVIIEVNSQTDFLALQDDFKGFVASSLEKAFADQLRDAAPLIEAQEEARLALVSKCGENVNIRRLTRVEGDVVGAYLHGHRIGVLVVLKGGNAELAREIAMHVAASNPQFVDPSQVSAEAVAKEKEIFLALNAEKIAGKPENIVENMVKGRINKFLAEASLVEQPFVKDPEIKVGELARKAGAEIVSFTRYEVGEGIDKAEVDFAAEVAAQVAASQQ
jgi:elongation factor Ts